MARRKAAAASAAAPTASASARTAAPGMASRLATASAARFGRLVSWTGDSGWRRTLALLLICAALFLPGIAGAPPTDRDEARFAQATKQMLESGDYVDPRFQDAPRHQKPIGVYWAQAASAALLGGPDAPIWAYRLPSALAATLAVLLTAWAATPLVGARAAFLAAAMTAGVLVLSFEARTAKADALMLACIVGAQGALARLWFDPVTSRTGRAWNVFALWTALGLGLLVKGPVALMPTIGSILWLIVSERSLRGLGRLGMAWGAIWLALIALPWYVAIGAKTGGGFFAASLGEDMLGKITDRREGAILPPGFYVAAFFGTFWPWTALALVAAPYVWRWRRAPESAFLLGWIIPAWLVFELVATKLAHYVLPLYPAIAAFTAAALLDGSARPRGLLFWIAAVLWALPALALPIGIALAPILLERRVDPGALAFGVLALVVLLGAGRWLLSGLWLGHVRAALVGAALLYAGAYHFAFPALDTIWLSKRLVEQASPHRACAAERTLDGRRPPLAFVRYHEPSAVFLAGADTLLLDASAAAQHLAEASGALVWVARRTDEGRPRPDDLEVFEAELLRLGLRARPLDAAAGVQYNGGRRLEATLFARADDPATAACPAAAAR